MQTFARSTKSRPKSMIDRPLAFHPSPFIRHNLAQTVLSVRKPKASDWFLATEQPILLDAGEDRTGYDAPNRVRLLAYYSSAAKPMDRALHGVQGAKEESRGLVLMLHGWQGCSHSTYNLVATGALLQAGYDVVRLNLRDHGPGLHAPAQQLNVGSFNGTLIEEAIVATQRVADMAQGRPFYIVGPSMGGNFALRLAIAHSQTPFPNLRHVVAISPAIDPGSATDALDSKPLYRRYFRNKWLESIKAKIHYYPEHFAWLREIEEFQSVREMTEWAIPQLTKYGSADAYFYQYSVRPENVAKIQVPTTIITAKDDPVIPAKDFDAFPSNPFLQMNILDYGGHVGFIDLFPFRHYLPDMILRALDEG